jgi:6-phosphogluconate dehydrogenase
MEPKADIALIGLAVMGQNLILNMNDHGFTVVAYNRTVEKVDHFLANEAKGTKVLGAHSIPEMVAQLKRPRRVMMLVKAGKAVDEFICCRTWKPVTSSLTAATPCSRTPSGAPNMLRAKACFTSVPA